MIPFKLFQFAVFFVIINRVHPGVLFQKYSFLFSHSLSKSVCFHVEI